MTAAGSTMPDVAPRPAILDLVVERIRLLVQRRLGWVPADAGNDVAAGATSRQTAPAADVDELEQVERALGQSPRSPLRRLGEIFRLSPREMDTFQTCLAAALDAEIGAALAELHRERARRHVTVRTLVRLFGHTGPMWNAASPLGVWGFVSAVPTGPGEPDALVVDPTVIGWLAGDLRIDRQLVGVVSPIARHQPLDSWPVDTLTALVRRAARERRSVRIRLIGPPGSGRATLAAVVAERLGVPALAIDTDAIDEASWPDAYMRIQRLAAFGGHALVWRGSGVARRWPKTVAPAPIQFVACEPGVRPAETDGTVDHDIELPELTHDERRALWLRHVPAAIAWPRETLATLSARQHLTVGDIVAVAAQAPDTAAEALAATRARGRRAVDDLAGTVECPFGWDDLVLPPPVREALLELAFEARERAAVWEQRAVRRLYARESGLAALFSGPPGTGKTMAAQVIAADLQVDLVRIDLAAVVSKYIGETAKNLGRIFTQAARLDAVLLFDEADALFGRRTEVKDAHDRHANTDTNHLLQLLEEHRGIVVLATNRKQDIDPAFVRRLRYVIEFPRPAAPERLLLWRQVIAVTGHEPLERLGAGLAALADSVELSGAQIKGAVLSALFAARRTREPLALPHLLHGLERELAKEGRSLAPRDRERLVRHG